MSTPLAEDALPMETAQTLDDATAELHALIDGLDEEGLTPEEISSWLLGAAYLLMSRHYVPGAVFDWMVEGTRCMIKDTADDKFNNQLQ